jgi:hypothetical protein
VSGPLSYSFTYRDPEGAKFAAHAFDRLIGTEVPWNLRASDDGPVLRSLGRVRVADAKVSEDGWSVQMTVEPVGDAADADMRQLVELGRYGASGAVSTESGTVSFSMPPPAVPRDLIGEWEAERRKDRP